MGRKPRIEYEGAAYHIIQRGNNREYIFENDDDKQYLLKQVEQCKRGPGLGFRLFGYVVMGNHYHLLLQTQEKPLNKIMHRINGNYGWHYNLKYQRSGHVFQGRYKAILIQDEGYLLAVLRYVHQNPVVAGMCATTADYRYSSDDHYRKNQSWLVDIDLVLDSLAGDRTKAIEKYIAFMAEEDDANYDEPGVIGDDSLYLTFQSQTTVPERKRLDEILVDTGLSPEDYKLIKAGSRRRHLTPYKRLYVEIALHHKYTLREIGDNIGLSDVAAFKLLQPKSK
jgi:REP element-mobilizing transposase RayT